MNKDVFRLAEVRIEFAVGMVNDAAILLEHLQQIPTEKTRQRIPIIEFRGGQGRSRIKAIDMTPDFPLNLLGPFIERVQDPGDVESFRPRQSLRGPQIEQSNVALLQCIRGKLRQLFKRFNEVGHHGIRFEGCVGRTT